MLNKHRNIFSYSFDCLKRYRMRSVAIIVTFLVATTMISAVLFAKDGLEREAEYSVSVAPDLTVQYLKAGRVAPIPATYADNVSLVDGVDRVLLRTWGYVGIGTNTYTVIGLDPSGLNYSGIAASSLESGRFLNADDSGTGNVVVGELIAGILDVTAGDDMILLSESVDAKRFHIVGVFSDKESIYTADMIVMSLEDANEFFKMDEGMVTDLCVYVNEGLAPQDVAAKMSTMPNVRILDQDLLLRGYKAAYAAKGGIFTTLWTIVLVAVALIAFSQAIVVGHESKFEVGLLKHSASQRWT